MKREWLQKKLETTDYVTLASEEIRSSGIVDKAAERDLLDRLAKAPHWARWEEFIRVMQPGDELWYYTSPKETWENLCGCAGYAIVRNSKIVSYLNTVRS